MKQVTEQDFQSFLERNPEITVERAFCELFRYYPDATVDELRTIFRKEMYEYALRPKS